MKFNEIYKKNSNYGKKYTNYMEIVYGRKKLHFFIYFFFVSNKINNKYDALKMLWLGNVWRKQLIMNTNN